MSTNPTWYDILGVPRDATPDQIKAAWRAATDKFEPGGGTSQFRLFNEAADVLLDPTKRSAYDAGLGAEQDSAQDAPVEPAKPTVEPEPEPVPDAEPAGVGATDDVGDQEPLPAPGPLDPTRPALLERIGSHLGWVAVVCVPLLVASVVAGVVAVAGVHVGKVDVEGIVPRVRTFDAGPDASAAAERALTAVLSYDYRHMDADRDRAARFLTPAYRKQYLKNFDDLLTKGPDGAPGPAVKTQAVVKADVLDTGIVDADPDRVRVIVFVNQSSVKGTGQPTIFQDRVVATMRHRGDSWLVDDIKSY
jgi:Mce-associated membrane protein